MTLKPCLVCGVPSESTRCPEHATEHNTARRGSFRDRGYDTAWTKLSERARRIQPWCSDCLTPDDLTVDHLPEAWARKAAGKPIRLQDVDVVCRDCNTARGSSRPRGDTPPRERSVPRRQAQSAIESGNHYHLGREGA